MYRPHLISRTFRRTSARLVSQELRECLTSGRPEYNILSAEGSQQEARQSATGCFPDSGGLPCAGEGKWFLTIDLEHYVGGTWRDSSGGELRDLNPADPSQVIACLHRATTDDLNAAAVTARQAFEVWSRTPMAERCAVLQRAATILDSQADQLGEELTREEGKPLEEGVGEVRRSADILRFYGGESLREAGEIYSSARANESILSVRRPLGVVGVITPWNFPIAIPAWKIAPALVYGNTVIWKPASLVPLLAYRLAQAFHNAGLPGGVLSLLFGDGAFGQCLVEHPAVDAVTFTGSTSIGRALIRKCGELGKPIQTEMGGKNAAVVLPDASLDLAADQIVLGAMSSTGQKCTATSRLIVAEEIADEVLRKVAERLHQLRIGDGLDPKVDMGPAASAGARDSIYASIAGAIDEGATVLAGGCRYSDGPLANGYFVPPTLLELPSTNFPIWREEVFGPVLVVQRAKSIPDAIRLANDSEFGLSGAVFTNDFRWISLMIEEFNVGVLHFNSETSGADPHVPFGGVKASGTGPKEQGRAAREFFTHQTTVYLKAGPAKGTLL